MSPQPLITIITVVYNNVKLIQQTITSVIEQTFKDYEYIIIDGGSGDGTLEVINKYDTYIKKWISEKDMGISDAFNKGINMSEGSWICFLNSGDAFYSKDTLIEVYKFLEIQEHKIITGFAVMTDGRLLPPFPLKNSLALNKKAKISHQASFVYREVFNKCGLFSINYKYRMDYEFWLRVFKFYDFLFVNIKIVTYDINGASFYNLREAFTEEIAANKEHLPNFLKVNTIIKLKLILSALIPIKLIRMAVTVKYFIINKIIK